MEKIFNKKTGDFGENIAENYLKKKGYDIIKKNYKTKYGEIDLICKNNNILIFTEVKTRIGENLGKPEDAIDRKKMQKLIKNAKAYVALNDRDEEYRIDVICIVLDGNNQLKRMDYYESVTF